MKGVWVPFYLLIFMLICSFSHFQYLFNGNATRNNSQQLKWRIKTKFKLLCEQHIMLCQMVTLQHQHLLSLERARFQEVFHDELNFIFTNTSFDVRAIQTNKIYKDLFKFIFNVCLILPLKQITIVCNVSVPNKIEVK